MRSCTRVLALSLIVLSVTCAACGGGPRSRAADVLAITQPTPDPTLDAVVRDLPRALAGVPPTPTPTAMPVVPKPAIKQAVATRVQPVAPAQKPTATVGVARPAATVAQPAATVAKPAATLARSAETVAKPAATPSRAAPIASPVRR
ncbi:MAG TPA: hypothetical protein VGJ60_24205 [Chloroflexota bacterium]|jgi:hypothetical protein